MLRRLCITVRRRAIALTYYFEAAGSRRPGGIMVSVFFLGVCCLLFFSKKYVLPWFCGFAPLV